MPKPKDNNLIDNGVVKPVFFANWADLIGFPLARKLLPFVLHFRFLTPNVITITAFLSYLLGCLFLVIDIPYHNVLTAVLLPVAFLLDDLDGQVARAKKLSSKIGDYLDKTLDVLKIYLVTICLSFAAFYKTNGVIYIFLGFTACFFFNYRYYIKLETMFSQINSDPEYLNKSSAMRDSLAKKLTEKYTYLSKSTIGKLKVFWLKNRIIFFVDEGEFAIFTAIFALLNTPELALWILSISQVLIALWRFIERGYQTAALHEALLKPMRK